jgi:uncharacterized protein (TIGR02757 family)
VRPEKRKRLKKILDRFYEEFNFRDHVLHDPIQFPRRYKTPEDKEVAGFIASCLAYGRVEVFMPVIREVLSPMGKNPHAFLMDFQVKKQGTLFPFKYRFNDTKDIVCLLYIIHRLLRDYASLEQAFKRCYLPEGHDIGKGITGFMEEVMSVDTSAVYGRNIHPPGMTQFFPSPAKGSTCKRMNLFLRWMIRDRDIDLGLWKGVPKHALVIPLDTHIARISRCLGLTDRMSSDWKTAQEITASLKYLDPEDPLKYDFALCHHGISGLCKAGDHQGCRGCILRKAGRTANRQSSLNL